VVALEWERTMVMEVVWEKRATLTGYSTTPSWPRKSAKSACALPLATLPSVAAAASGER
jgi:hypothetical protein